VGYDTPELEVGYCRLVTISSSSKVLRCLWDAQVRIDGAL